MTASKASSIRRTGFVATSVALFALGWALAFPSGAAAGESRGKKKMRPAGEMVRKQAPPKITARLKEKINPENSYVIVSLSKQRAYLMVDGETYIDTPISSGKRAGMTPTGSFSISQKHKDHRSNIYGNFVDSKGRIVRGGISLKIDSAPAGTHYVGAPMWYFMRLTDSGVGMHVGILPGYPASHGCIRLPEEIAPLIYEKVRVGTKVTIEA
jgi:lipoprotein-anchoring transpeptidase ErfK/SrfK